MKKETIELLCKIATAILTIIAGWAGGATTAYGCTLLCMY